MGIQIHTPDPIAGAAVDAANSVALPDDGEKVKCDNIRLGDEQIADWLAFIKGGGSGAYVNATAQPAGGYTFTGNPGIIKGTGLRMDGSPLDFAGGGSITGTGTVNAALTWSQTATLDGLIAQSFDTIGDVSSTITVSKHQYRCSPPTATNRITKIANASPEPPFGYVWTVTIWQLKASVGHTRDIVRADDEVIATFLDDTFNSVTLSWHPDQNKWYVIAATGCTLVNPA